MNILYYLCLILPGLFWTQLRPKRYEVRDTRCEVIFLDLINSCRWMFWSLGEAGSCLPAAVVSIHHRGREGARPATAIRKPTYNESIISKREI